MWIPDNFKEKWGWGWIIICLFFFSPQASKGYDTLGTTGKALQLFGCAVAIVLYFLLRQKVLKKIGTTWVRSLISGVVAYGSVWLILFLLGRSFVSAQSLDGREFFNLIDDETSKLTTYMENFAKRNQQLSNIYITNPENQQEIMQNISTVELLSQLYYSKDSTILAITKRLHTGLSNAFAESETFQKNFPISPTDFQSVIDLGDSLTVEHQNVMNALLEYQKALFRKDRNSDNFLQVYLNSNDALSLKEKSFALIYQRLFGQDVFAKIKRFEDKYYK